MISVEKLVWLLFDLRGWLLINLLLWRFLILWLWCWLDERWLFVLFFFIRITKKGNIFLRSFLLHHWFTELVRVIKYILLGFLLLLIIRIIIIVVILVIILIVIGADKWFIFNHCFLRFLSQFLFISFPFSSFIFFLFLLSSSLEILFLSLLFIS